MNVLTDAERKNRARILARYVSRRVREIVPHEVLEWPDAQSFVRVPSLAFTEALNLWKQGRPYTDAQLQDCTVKAANAVFAAWKDAGVAYEAARDREAVHAE